MPTPESKTKAQVRKILDRVPDLYYEMPVPSGYGKSGLDFNGCVRGHAFFIETKAPDEELRPRQRERARRMYLSGAVVFVVSDQGGLDSLARWLARAGVLRLPQ